MHAKNVLLKDAYRDELRETMLGLGLALFFAAGCGAIIWLWLEYNARLGLSEAVQAAFATVYAFVVAGLLIRFGGGHAIERGKKAVYYYRRLAVCPVDARGRR
ncbi:MAG: hypothetical protein U0487_01745 [Patescibacteria group bacterium]